MEKCTFCGSTSKNHIQKCPECGGQLHVFEGGKECATCGRKFQPDRLEKPKEQG